MAKSNGAGRYIGSANSEAYTLNDHIQEVYLKDSTSLVYNFGCPNSSSKLIQVFCNEKCSTTAKQIWLPKQKIFICVILLLVFISLKYFELSLSEELAYITNATFICKCSFIIIKSFNLIKGQYGNFA